MSQPESRVLNDVLRMFGSRSDMRIWRANVGAMRAANGRVVHFGVPGQADITGIVPVVGRCMCGLLQPSVGVRLEIETKSARGRQEDDQVRYQKIIQRLGGLYILARSARDVSGVMNAWLAERQLCLEEGVRDENQRG